MNRTFPLVPALLALVILIFALPAVPAAAQSGWGYGNSGSGTGTGAQPADPAPAPVSHGSDPYAPREQPPTAGQPVTTQTLEDRWKLPSWDLSADFGFILVNEIGSLPGFETDSGRGLFAVGAQANLHLPVIETPEVRVELGVGSTIHAAEDYSFIFDLLTNVTTSRMTIFQGFGRVRTWYDNVVALEVDLGYRFIESEIYISSSQAIYPTDHDLLISIGIRGRLLQDHSRRLDVFAAWIPDTDGSNDLAAGVRFDVDILTMGLTVAGIPRATINRNQAFNNASTIIRISMNVGIHVRF